LKGTAETGGVTRPCGHFFSASRVTLRAGCILQAVGALLPDRPEAIVCDATVFGLLRLYRGVCDVIL
jgi:hypothetical protein